MATILPPNEIFAQKSELLDSMGGYVGSNWIKTVCPSEGGVFSYYLDQPYPRRGHMYPDGCEANNLVKKLTVAYINTFAIKELFYCLTLTVFLPYQLKVKILEKFLKNYNRMGNYTLRNHFLRFRYYNTASRELWKLTFLFFRKIGLSFSTALETGRIVANLFEYDDFYQAILRDLFTEMTQEEFLKNPRKALQKMAEIYVSRDSNLREGSVGEKFINGIKIVSLLLFIPKIKNAFLFAIRDVNIKNLQLDESDKYFALGRDSAYNFMGRNNESRFPEYIDAYNRFTLYRFKKEIIKGSVDPIAAKNVIQQLAEMGV